jgi:diguanylate cyclase (GGDEF)-like protein/PAS domain S-box-containing protein
MGKRVSVFILIAVILITILFSFSIAVNAQSVEFDFDKMFEEHGTIMLLIDSETGQIEQANKAASRFYGYPVDQLETMNMCQINVLDPDEVERRIQEVVNSQRSYYTLQQKTAGGDIRTVEVYLCPHTYEDKTILFATIYDITDKVELEKRNRSMQTVILSLLIVAIAIIGIFSFVLLINMRKLKDRTREIRNHNELRKTFIDAIDDLVYLKDENLKYIFANKALQNLYGKGETDIIGSNDFELLDEELARKQTDTDINVIKNHKTIVKEVSWKNRIYKVTKFPIELLNGNYGVGAYILDVTEAYHSRIKQEKTLLRNQILVNVLSHNFNSTQEQLDYALNKSLKLTESKFGYIYLYNEECHGFIINSWAKNAMNEMKGYEEAEKQIKNQLENTNLLGDVIRQRGPIIKNDYNDHNNSNNTKNNIKLSKFMSVPIIIDGIIVAVVELANKENDYDYNDVYQITALMNGVWNAIERRKTHVELAVEKNKLFQTLASIGDAVIAVNLEGKVTMLNRVAETLTGWTFNEAYGKHYKEVFCLSHEYEGYTIEDSVDKVLKTDTIQELDSYAVLTSRYGDRFYVEESASPIKDDKNNTTGVVLVFRDVTEKREQSRKIEYLSYHDSLTNLYNRVFFEKELRRLDTKWNLPLSIIEGDVNGLKLANDIFGHAAGDLLLKKIAECLKKACREDDIIARVGGDEFYILLPKTKEEDAQKIMSRIKELVSKENIKAIKCSISMGCAAKTDENEDISQTIIMAEKRMYSVKTLDRNKLKSSTVEAIIKALYENNPREREHAKRVSKMCESIGKRMGLSEDEVRKLKDAGFLHDIGKIVLDENLPNNPDESLPDSLEELNIFEEKKMNEHPVTGFRILNSFDETIDLAEPVLAHHEMWDGSGYPRGLKGEQISQLARIITVAGYFDEMATRQNNKISNKESVIRELSKYSGVKFDPVVVDLLIKILSEKE